MAEIYFPGFEFRRIERVNPIEIVTFVAESGARETIRLSDLCDLEDIAEESTPKVWNQNKLYQEFTSQLNSVGRQIKHPGLTMRQRTMQFVTREAMRPKNDIERQLLVERYGDYVADGAGDCTRNPNGTFTLRIGFLGQEDTASKEEVLDVMAHEYGHTLGSDISDPTFEELKAYTFARLLMRQTQDVEYGGTLLDNSTVHNTAQLWLEQLVANGISEEKVLAHLTGNKFGTSYPDDYRK